MKPLSLRITFIVFALFLFFAALAAFGLIDLTTQNLTILNVAAVLIVFIEIGLVQAFRSRGKSVDLLGLIGLIAGIIVLVTIMLGFLNVTVAVLNPIQGLVYGALVVSFVVESIR